MSNYMTWGTTSSSTYISNTKAELKPLKALLKKHEEIGIKLAEKIKKEQEPVLFDPKDLDI